MHANSPAFTFKMMKVVWEVTVIHAPSTSSHDGPHLPCQIDFIEFCPEKEKLVVKR